MGSRPYKVLFGAIWGNGNDVRDIFVSTRYRCELPKKWGGREIGNWETWRRTGVGCGVCEVLFHQIRSNQIKIYIAPYVHEDSEALGG